MKLSNLSNNIYVINLPERTDRKEHILKELNKIECENYIIFNAINGNNIINPTSLRNGMYGLVRTYQSIYEDWKVKNPDNILIIEDDCVFTDNFNSYLEEYVNNIPSDWEMMYFGGNHNYHMGYTTQKVNNYCIKLNYTFSAHCVLLKNYVFEELINNLNNLKIENDVMMAHLQKKYNAYSPLKTMASQITSYSNIENMVVNYDWLIK